MRDGALRDLVPPSPTFRPQPEISPGREKAQYLRGVSGLRQKYGLGGQGWRRRGGAKRRVPEIGAALGAKDKGGTPGFLPSSFFSVPRIPKAISQEA